MQNITFFCLTINPEHEEKIKKLSYIPVGLGSKNFSKECMTDKSGENISHKNPYYGEYTFHYWIWKNYLEDIKTEWVGFCQYRKFFLKEKIHKELDNFKNLNNSIVHNIDDNLQDFECILGTKFSVENYKISKVIKNYLLEFLKNPSKIFNKKKRNLKFHFDLFHGKGNLDIAINCLDEKNRKDFMLFMNNQTNFNPHNMFMCKTKILKNYYDVIFPWLEKCENRFGFENLEGYGLKRIYGFLAERFLSYWFTKNYKVKELPIIVKDLSNYKDLKLL
tara:strand:+ start:780 stop:1610 length:831 start_codon:yes stop_codon:yes gene_type:complete